MITSQKAMQIMFEPDAGKRDSTIDAFSEQSAKALLKICLKMGFRPDARKPREIEVITCPNPMPSIFANPV